ncbi:MAG: hypothetical protein AUI10_02535 [Actinobacteria bacterium 13_2_20CM_2_72_6]|nr:MAG: hypothetical protein AUI10_02535 [Actinobacteria bacterium 13_2_20CM_2_72_6]
MTTDMLPATEVAPARARRVVPLIVSVLAVCWMVLAVIGSVGVLVPSVPLIGLAGLYVNGFAAQLFLFGLVGAGAAVAVHRLGRRRTALVTGVVAGLTLIGATVPTVALMMTAHRLGAPVSLPRALVPVRNVGTADPTRTVGYATVDGEDLNLDVWLPKRGGGQPSPAVVFVHGGGFVKGSRSETPQWDHWLNDAGYAVFDVSYRLAPPARWDEAAADVTCALAWLQANAARYGIDPGRVALGGRSAGGNLALSAAYAAPGLSSCGGTPVPVRAVFPPADPAAGRRERPVRPGSTVATAAPAAGPGRRTQPVRGAPVRRPRLRPVLEQPRHAGHPTRPGRLPTTQPAPLNSDTVVGWPPP